MVEIIIAVVAAVIGVFIGQAFRRREFPVVRPPKQTSEEVKNDDAETKASAIKEAAAHHGVPVDVVADDLEWLLSGEDV